MDTEDTILIEESSVTARGYRHRTTIPSRIYRFLKLKNKDRLRWIVLKDGKLIVQKEPVTARGYYNEASENLLKK